MQYQCCERHIYFVRLISHAWYMTSQLTPERTSTLPAKTDEARERPLILQPWFLMAILSIAAIVLVVATS
jgi:hypothetical protein